MSVLLAGKPELSVGFPRHKIASDQPSTNAWESRYGTEGCKPPSVADTTTPPADPGPGCGMCARADEPRAPDQSSPAAKTITPSSAIAATIMDIAIRCTAPNCPCDGFTPSKPYLRLCDSCQHGWVAHALDKLGFRHLFNCHQVELVQPTVAFDVASLMLYGTEALPIRLKILLDRLFSVLQRDEVVHVLHGFGWTYEDYARGYILQDARGQVLERWSMPTREEEPLILQQFLRFGETKPIAQQLLLQESCEKPDHIVQGSREYSDSDIKRFIQRTNRVPTAMPLLRPSHSSTPSSSTPGAVALLTPTTTSSAMLSTPLPAMSNRISRQASSVSSTASLSPTTASPINSPLSSSSPLNKLQNMQPYDFRRDRNSPDTRPPEVPLLSFSHHATSLPSPTATTFATHLATSVTNSYVVSSNSTLMGMTSDLSATDEGSENDTNGGAINLTQHHPSTTVGHGHMDSIYAAKKIRHLRKSANPMKRRWNPMMLSGLVTNPSTGKKRVQCHVCLKTFCDKGALKIHFSAVHLREMHKCTVDGCNMMFSSRRSRNRHSANPNPKLHTPNLRRKLSHHDGRSSLPFPLIPSSSLMNYNTGSSSLLAVPPTLHPVIPSDVEREDRTVHSTDLSSRGENNLPSSTVDDSPPEGSTTHALQHRKNMLHSPDEALSLTKKPRLEMNGDISNDGDEGIDLTVKDDNNQMSSLNKGVRKRKSFNPTKCPVTSDDDLQYVSTDDSSSGTFVDDNGLLSKSDEFSSDLLEDDSKDDDLDRDSSSAPLPSSHHPTTSTSFTLPILPPPIPTHIFKPEDRHEIRPPNLLSFAVNSFRAENLSRKDNEISSLDLSKQREPVIKHNPEMEEVLESPLRHLETLSLGAFTGLLNHTKSTFSQHLTSSTGISFHAPGLGLASACSTTIPDPLPREKSLYVPTSESQPIPIPIPSSGVSVNASDSDPDGQIQMLPVYRDASMMGAVDVPVDKENPRRCIACGKIFQNHFGVKTHYQNVHLKLMHKCTVEGCNAAFPSKRSRDRHSANLNLHRKLLSTTADKGHYFDKSAIFPYPHPGAALRDDFFSRLYDPQSLPLNFADIYHGRLPEGFLSSSPFGNHLGPAGPLGMMPSFHPAFMVPTTSTSGSSLHDGGAGVSDGREDTPISSISSTPSPRPKSPSSPSPHKDDRRGGRKPLTLDAKLTPDTDGRFSCNFCQRLFVDASHLRDHYEGTHLPSLLPCPTEDCSKVFLTASVRDKHCLEEDHHHHRVKRESPSVS